MLFIGTSTVIFAQESIVEKIPSDLMDSVEISLLTCQPHDEIYSLYGHTAIRFHDMRKKQPIDVAFNYGVFDFKKSFFILRFVFGLTDYELGVYPYQFFSEEYRRLGCMVTEQVINLTNEEKEKLKEALYENLRPENRTYRYNYFYNNCTTKARDIIEQSINGKIEYTENKDVTTSYRDMVHEMTRNHPWARWGNDFLLGFQSDFQTEPRQQEFLPHQLMYDFDHAQIYEAGQYRPLVKNRRIAVPAGVQIVQQEFPLSPKICGWLLAVVGIIIFCIEIKLKKTFRLWDVLIMFVTGLFGMVLTLMLFSQHPTVSMNLQIILFNPLPWLFLWSVAKNSHTPYWLITLVLSLLFMFGGIFQTYPEGIWSLALCLLLQCYIHLQILSK